MDPRFEDPCFEERLGSKKDFAIALNGQNSDTHGKRRSKNERLVGNLYFL